MAIEKHALGWIVIFFGLTAVIGGMFVAQSQSPAQEAVHPHHALLKNPDGTWKYTNALADQTSPYLLQHAHNPVRWHPWGPEAFDLARKEGKPIFLSIGYATCYWCHVMERQVFENPELAAMLNKHCISIKVDREERPDVDDLYMTAVQMMTGHGGWPMSVFLTPPGAAGQDDPGLKPFWGGTYIPPEPRHGLPGFGQLVEGIADAWNTRRPEVVEQADRIAQEVRQQLGQHNPGQTQLDIKSIQVTANQLMRMYDQEHGGFGGAPKFPQPANLLFLLKAYQNNPNADLWQALAFTLERMARGGVYDQIGGGFHRYATDEKWLVPHFEKMLYDNAQLVEVYLIAQAVKPDAADPELYERVARETCDYVIRQMTDSSGAFWSAQDAEVDSREGGNYLWTPQGVNDAVGDTTTADLATRMYGLDRGTNFQDPHHRDEPPTNVLYLPERLDQLAQKVKTPLDKLLAMRTEINQHMLAVRDRRKQPLTDDKVLTSWNGMMIAAMAQAGAQLNEPRYTAAAVLAADSILKHMITASNDGQPRLLRTMRQGQAKIPAFLEDYAYLAHGLIELHRATGEDRWLNESRRLTATAQALFNAKNDRGGGYYDTLADQSDLFVRTVSTYDGAVPTGNSQMAHNLLDLFELTQDRAYLDRAVTDLQAFSDSLTRRGVGMVHMQHALLRAIEIAPNQFQSLPPSKPNQTAKPDQPVTVSVAPNTIDLSTGQAKVQVTLQIAPGYHINASDPGMIGLIPTTLELEAAGGLALGVEYPPGVTKQYPFAEEPLDVYEGSVTFTATIRKSGGVSKNNTGSPRLVLRYQACTDSDCQEPETVELSVVFNGLP